MSLKEKIIQDFKKAFKEKDQERKSALEQVLSEVRNKEIELKKREKGLNDEEVIAVISRAIKQRKDAMEQYQRGNREDLYEKEKKELEILAQYLPQQLSEEEVKREVAKTIDQLKATGKEDFGKVMGALMGKLKGKADGNLVKRMVEELLK